MDRRPERGDTPNSSILRLPWRDRLGLWVQNLVSFLLAPITLSLVPILARWKYRWTLAGHRELRRSFRREMAAFDGPLVLCGNHLTMVDSVLILWALAPTWWYLLHFRRVPWNVPERRNFASRLVLRWGSYIAKCVPVTRGGDRAKVARVLAKLGHLLREDHAVLLFPEGGRSRTGRITLADPARGPGRLIKDVPNARVLCVYLRGEHQRDYSFAPVRGERFHCEISWVAPISEHRGLRGSVEISTQILERLQSMEERFFRDRE